MTKRKLNTNEDKSNKPQKKSRSLDDILVEQFWKKMESCFVINGYRKEDQVGIIEELKSKSLEERITNINQKVGGFFNKIRNDKLFINSMIHGLNFDLLKSYREVKNFNQKLLIENSKLNDLNNSLHEIYEKEKKNNSSLFTESHEINKDVNFPENFDIQIDDSAENVIEFDFENLPFPECINFNDKDQDEMFVNDELIVY